MHQNITQNKNYLLLITVILAVLMAAISLFLRSVMLSVDLPYYSIDENDVVEPALAFVAGSWDPGWHKYGPLFSYLLACVYTIHQWILQVFYDWSVDNYFYAAFFDSGRFYLIARVVHLITILSIVLVSIRFCWKHYGINTVLILAIISIAPLYERLTDFTVRIDTLQGLFVLLTLYFAVDFDARDLRYRAYIKAGIFAGLAIAVKPLTGLLLLPSIFIAHSLALSWNRSDGIKSLMISTFFKNKGIYVFLLVLIVAHFLVHPYALINFDLFWQDQMDLLLNKSSQGGAYSGYDFSWLFSRWGVLLATLALVSPLVLVFRRDRITTVLAVYLLTFVLAFVLFDVRIYWYNSIVPVVSILMAVLLVSALQMLGAKINKPVLEQAPVIISVGLLLIIFPVVNLWAEVTEKYVLPRSDMAAQNWIEKNISSGSNILAVGWFATTLPRLKVEDAQAHAKWAEHFMYNRNKNVEWVNHYIKAHFTFSKSPKPKYHIVNMRYHYQRYSGELQVSGLPLNDVLNKYLPVVAQQYKLDYIVTAGESGFVGEWESIRGVELLQNYSVENGYRGANIKVFRLISGL